MAFGDVLDFAVQTVLDSPSQGITVTLPLGAPDEGDLLVACGITQNNTPSTAITRTGWLPVGTHVVEGGDGYDMLYRVAEAGDPAAMQFMGLGNGKRMAVVRLEGPWPEDPLDPGVEEAVGAVAFASVDVTPAEGFPAVAIGQMLTPPAGGGGPWGTPGTDMIELDDGLITGGSDPAMWMGYRVIAETSGTYTLSATQTSVGFNQWAFRGAVFLGGTAPIVVPTTEILTPELVPITTLSGAYEQVIRWELNGPGSGRFKINKNDPQATAANLARGNIVRMYFPEIDPAQPIFEFILQEGDFELISDREKGGEVLTFGGPGTLEKLKSAQVWFESNVVGSGWVLEDRGVWRFEDESYGYIIRQMIQEAVNRGALTNIDVHFGAINDSNDVPWPTFDGRYELQVGARDVYDEVMALVEQGKMRVRMDPGLIFRGFQLLGGDKTGDFGDGVVRFEKGRNIVTGLQKAINGKAFATHAMVRGANGWIEVESPTYTPGDERIEVVVDQSGISDTTELTNAGLAALVLKEDAQQAIRLAHLPGNDPDNGRYWPGPAWTANGRYMPGDLATLHTGDGELEYDEVTQRIYAITIEIGPTGKIRAPIVELNAPFPGRDRDRTDNSVIVNRNSPSGTGTSTPHAHPYQFLYEKSQPDGYASLDGSGRVPDEELPVGTAADEVAAGDHTHPTGAIDHGGLAGLGDDDHPQYALDAHSHTAITRWEPHVDYSGSVVLNGNGDPVMVEVAI